MGKFIREIYMAAYSLYLYAVLLYDGSENLFGIIVCF